MVTLLITNDSDFSYREYAKMQTKCWDKQFQATIVGVYGMYYLQSLGLPQLATTIKKSL